jgi:hypothetical protein
MKRKYLFLCVLPIFLFSCINIKEKATSASNIFINDIIYDINNIVNYYYNPTEGIYYVFLNIDNDIIILYDEIEENDISPNYTQYIGDDVINKLNKLKSYFGQIIKYEIIDIKYEYDIFPFYDYGYPHGVIIKLLVYYNNIILSENIYGYYIKEIDKIKMVSYDISALR